MNKDKFLCQVQHWTVRTQLQAGEVQRWDELLGLQGSMWRSSIVDEYALAHSPRTQVISYFSKMVHEYFWVNCSFNNVKCNHFFKGVWDDAGETLSILVGWHPYVLSFRGPTVAAYSLVRKLVFITEDEPFAFVDIAHYLLCTLDSFLLVVFSESIGRTVMQDLVGVPEFLH